MIIQNKFYSQFINGESFNLLPLDYSTILVGSIGDKIQKVTRFSYSKKSVANSPFEFVVDGNNITFNGDFIVDGFKVNDFIDLHDDGGASFIFQDREILSISSNSITFDGAAIVGPLTITDGRVILKTELISMKHSFGLIGLTESTNYVSKVDGIAENTFFADNVGFDSGGGRSTTPVSMVPVSGVKSWQTDEVATAAYISTGTLANDFEQVFEVVHTFRILPFYLDGELTNLQNEIAPALLNGSNSLKYVSKTDLAAQSYLLDGTRTIELDTLSGSVGWYNENLNGLFAEYELLATSYVDTASTNNVSGLQTNLKTSVTTTVKSNNLKFVDGLHNVQLSVSHSVSNYTQNNNTIEDNFLYETAFKQVASGPVSNSRITNFETTIITPEFLEITFDYEFAPTDNATGLNNVIFITVSDEAETNVKTDRVALLAETVLNQTNTDVDDLILMNSMLFNPQDTDLTGSAFNNISGWLEDGFICNFDFDLNADELTNIKSLVLNLAVYNSVTQEYFKLQQVPFNVGVSTIISGMQYFNQSAPFDKVNFILPKGSDWKKKHLITNGPGMNGPINTINHSLICGMRLNYESWIALPGADTFFYDVSLPNNGLNLDSSRFDESPFEVVVIMEATVEDTSKIPTDYRFISQPFSVQDYDEDGNVPAAWSGVIELFNQAGNPVDFILENEKTRVKFTFEKTAATAAIIDSWGRIRLYKENSSIHNAYEIGTYENPISFSNPLIPLPGETKLKITNLGSTITIEAEIDNTLISNNENWCISGRIGENSTSLFEASIETTFVGGVTGLWDFDFGFSRVDGGPIGSEIVRLQVYDPSTDDIIADVEYLYGQSPVSLPPINDYVGNWVSDVQQYIQAGTVFIDGGSGGFTKLLFAFGTARIDSAVITEATELNVRIKISNSLWSDDLMDIRTKLGRNHGEIARYDSVSETFVFGKFLVGNNYASNKSLTGNTFIENTPFTSDRNFYADFDTDNLTNGYPHIYFMNRIGVDNYQLNLVEFDGVQSLVKTPLPYTATPFVPGIIKTYIPINGKPSFFSTGHGHNTALRPVLIELIYWDGVAWTSTDFTSLIPLSVSGGNPGFQIFGLDYDNQGRLFYTKSRIFSQAHAFVGRLTWSGVGNIFDVVNWTNKVVCGQAVNSTAGDTDGLGPIARFGGGSQYLRELIIDGYDINNEPIIYVNDRQRQKIKKLTHSIATDEYLSTTFIVTNGFPNNLVKVDSLVYFKDDSGWNQFDFAGTVTFVTNAITSNTSAFNY